MKKTLTFLLIGISFGMFAQTYPVKTLIVDWGNDTVRDPSTITANMVKNWNNVVNYLPIIGLDPNYEAFVYKADYYPPPVNQLLYETTPLEIFYDSVDVNYANHRIAKREYVVTMRDSTDLYNSVDYLKSQANNGVMSIEERFEYLLLYAVYLDKKFSGDPILPTVENEIAIPARRKGEKIWQNRVLAKLKKQQIGDEESFDLELGWVTSDDE